jgi:rRNA maturation endonuclease Nob1
MKKFVAIMAGCLLLGGFSAMAEPGATDQKWLTAVQKMVEDGQTRVSTPSEERVKLLKEWAAKQGLSVEVTKTDAGFSIKLQKKVAKN